MSAPYAVDLDRRDTVQQYPLGALYEDPLVGTKFRYMKFTEGTAAVDATVGHVVIWDGAVADWTNTLDVSDEAVTMPAGFAQAAFSNNEFGWFQTAGPNRKNITTDGGVAAHEKLVVHTTDGTVDTMAAGEEHHVVGVALADDGTTTATVLDPYQAYIELE